MLTRIQTFFKTHLVAVANESSTETRERAYQLAAAALLVEMSRADVEVQPAEKRAIANAIQRAFDLTEAQTGELISMAEIRADEATSLFEFTRLINDNFDDLQKAHMVELLWQVAYADGDLDKYEEHLVRMVADLIYVPHSQYIRAKHRARKRFEAISNGD